MKTIGIRDNICVKKELTTCGSKILENFTAPYHAAIIDKLGESTEIKKINIKEFGLEEDDYIKKFFEENNADAAILTDLDGQIARNAVNGLVGLKPTFGLVSRSGVITIAPSLEQIGVISKSIEGIGEIFDVIKGYDSEDSGSVNPEGVEAFNAPVKIGYIQSHEDLNKTGLKTEQIEIQNLKYAKPTHEIIVDAEISSNLGKYDGIRYGYRTDHARTWKEVYTKTRQEGFGYASKKKMIAGTFFLDVDNMQEYYIKAAKIRTLIKRELEEIFKQVDIIAVPSDKEYTCLANLTGRPALTINGITLIGKHFDEENLMNVAKAMMRR